MKQHKVFIVEDEVPAQKLLEKWISLIPELKLMGIFSDGFSALKAIQTENPDLVLLDIEIPKLTGLEMLELIENPPQIIFTTAYHEYAVKAFELAAVDYLLKPFSFDRFKVAIEKALSSIDSTSQKINDLIPAYNSAAQNSKPIDRIVVKEGVEITVIPISEIIYFEAQDDYVMIYTSKNRHLKLTSLRVLENGLPKQDFVRVHRSYIVHVQCISKIENYNKDSHQIILTNGEKLKISRSGLTLLRKILFL